MCMMVLTDDPKILLAGLSGPDMPDVVLAVQFSTMCMVLPELPMDRLGEI